MKKKIVTMLLLATLSVSVVGCGTGSFSGSTKENSKTSQSEEKEEEAKEPTDLTGVWASENKDGSYQEATITDDSIEITGFPMMGQQNPFIGLERILHQLNLLKNIHGLLIGIKKK